MRIAVVGAGFSGISTLKYLREFGHSVTVFEKNEDVGGVWSAARRYPGVATQNSKDTYYLSDMPMPKHYPTWPSDEQVQNYLEAYVAKHNLGPNIQLRTTVVRTEKARKGWSVTVQREGSESTTDRYDHLVVCNGTFSLPNVPSFDGQDDFRAAGGHIFHSSDMRNGLETVRDKKVVVIGYGKSSCDVANALSETASSTTLVARRLIWKIPRKICGLPYQYLFLTRLGESLFEYIRPGPVERFLNSGCGVWLRAGMLASIQALVTSQLSLEKLGLVPPGRFEDIARATISLSTEGLYQKVADGKISVLRDCHIQSLGKDAEGRPTAFLNNGEAIPCDMVVCATGFQQRASFLPEDVQRSMLDDEGNWLLHRHILPIGIPDLTFNGYNSSLFCPTSCEAAALWIVAHLDGQIALPDEETQRRIAREKLDWMEERGKGKHAKGTNLVPFSLHSIDDILDDVGINVTQWARFRQWLLPVRPADYTNLSREMHRRISSGAPQDMKQIGVVG